MDGKRLGRASGRGLHSRNFGKPLRSSGLQGLSSRKWSEIDQADEERVCEWDHELNFVVKMMAMSGLCRKCLHLP